MTNEDFEKRMEFIIEQQARFASDIQQLHEAQAQTEEIVVLLARTMSEGFRDFNEKIDALVNAQVRTDDAIRKLTEAQARTDDNVRKLADAQVRTDDNVRKLADAQSRTHETVQKLADAQSHTDDTLGKLIAVVDRYFREGRNGASGQQ